MCFTLNGCRMQDHRFKCVTAEVRASGSWYIALVLRSLPTQNAFPIHSVPSNREKWSLINVLLRYTDFIVFPDEKHAGTVEPRTVRPKGSRRQPIVCMGDDLHMLAIRNARVLMDVHCRSHQTPSIIKQHLRDITQRNGSLEYVDASNLR